MSGPVVIAGASGFVGQRLASALEARRRPVRRGTRDPASRGSGWVALDVDRPETLTAALAGADTLVYLVHQMRGAHGPDLVDRERASAEAVRDACAAAGLRRIVYLGGPAPQGAASEHLAARLITGEVLRSGPVSCIELRAAMILGIGSESWTMTRDLACRLPVMVLPRWVGSRSSPIGIEDVIRALSAAIDDPLVGSAAFDLPGPEVVTAREVLERIARLRGARPLMVPVPVLTPSLSAHWLRFVTRADYSVSRQLVDGLVSDLVPLGESYWTRMGASPEPLEPLIRELLEQERRQVQGWGALWERAALRLSRPVRG